MSGFVDLKTVKEYLQSQGDSLNNLNGAILPFVEVYIQEYYN